MAKDERKTTGRNSQDNEAYARTTEEQLHEIIAGMTEGLVCYDDEMRVVLCNDAYRDIFGYSENDVRPGTHCRDLIALDKARGVIADGASYTKSLGK